MYLFLYNLKPWLLFISSLNQMDQVLNIINVLYTLLSDWPVQLHTNYLLREEFSHTAITADYSYTNTHHCLWPGTHS